MKLRRMRRQDLKSLGEQAKCIQAFDLESRREIYNLEDLVVDGMIILKWTESVDGFIWCGTGTESGLL
jgi:hypothetical protein